MQNICILVYVLVHGLFSKGNSIEISTVMAAIVGEKHLQVPYTER